MGTRKQAIISLVAAMGRNREIGRNNKLPWKIQEDMQLFRQNTMGKTILMGRNTALSMPGRLPHRFNLVLTQGSAPYAGQLAVRSIAEALPYADGELMIIGGQQLYTAALPHASKLYLSLIDIEVPDADTFFPEYDKSQWEASSGKVYAAGDSGEPPGFEYFELDRKGSPAPL